MFIQGHIDIISSYPTVWMRSAMRRTSDDAMLLHIWQQIFIKTDFSINALNMPKRRYCISLGHYIHVLSAIKCLQKFFISSFICLQDGALRFVFCIFVSHRPLFLPHSNHKTSHNLAHKIIHTQSNN